MTTKLTLLFITLFYFSTSDCLAQNSMNTSGGNASGSGGSASYTAGQVFYTTNGTNITEAQGVQQAYEIIDGVNEPSSFSYQIFPNPATDQIILETSANQEAELSYRLFDSNGKLILQNSVQPEKTLIDMSSLAKATYVITIYDGHESAHSCKIIKK